MPQMLKRLPLLLLLARRPLLLSMLLLPVSPLLLRWCEYDKEAAEAAAWVRCGGGGGEAPSPGAVEWPGPTTSWFSMGAAWGC